MNRVVFALIAILCLLSISSLTGLIQTVKADGGAIYIRADGSIYPSTAPIYTIDNVTYVFTGNIFNDSLVVERDSTVVDGRGYTVQGTNTSVIGIDLSGRSNVTVTNAVITSFPIGIYINSSSHVQINENNITMNEFDGVRFDNSSENILDGNSIGNNQYGIRLLDSSSNNDISGNDITNNNYGVYLDSSPNNTIDGNTIANSSSDGIHFEPFCENNTVNENNIIYNGYGVSLGTTFGISSNDDTISKNNITANFYGIYLASSSDQIITGNDITENNAWGIWLGGCSNNTVIGNDIAMNGYGANGLLCEGIALSSSSNNSINENDITANYVRGILVDSSSNNSIIGNNITTNDYGISLSNSQDNYIFYNNFVNNAEQVSCMSSTSIWDNNTYGNYWSDYNGTDANHDGIGDTPYVIDANNTDHHPLMVQYLIPEFPSFLILSLLLIATLLTVIIYKKKGVKTSQS